MGDFFKGYDNMPLKPKITIVDVECGDWVGLYINGKVEVQGHNLYQYDWIQLIEKYGCFNQEINTYTVSDVYGEEYGNFPDKLEQIPKEYFI